MTCTGVLLRYGNRALPRRFAPVLYTSTVRTSTARVPPLNGAAPRRAESTVVSGLSWWPEPLVHFAQSTFCSIQQFTGLPWWASILVVAATTKLAVLPLELWQAHNTAKLKLALPEIQVRQNAFLPNLMEQCKTDNAPYDEYQRRHRKLTSQTVSKVLKKRGVIKYLAIFTTLTQIPIWISMAVGLRTLSCGIDLNGFPGVTLGLTEGGFLWFSNLTLPDPCYVLPVLFPLMFWCRAEMHSLLNPPPKGRILKALKMFVRILPIPFVFIFLNSPSSILLYLFSLSFLGTAQDWLIYQPRVRRWLCIPKAPDEHGKPLQKMAQEISSRTRKFIAKQK